MLKRSDLSDAKRDRYLDAIVETAERAAALTSHLLAFGRRQALKPQVIDLNVRLDALADVLGRMLGSHIEVKLDLGAGPVAGRGRSGAARIGPAQRRDQRPRRDARTAAR